jgi:hypothetical protein
MRASLTTEEFTDLDNAPDREPEQRCASRWCADYRRTLSNNWMIGPRSICASCEYAKTYSALETLSGLFHEESKAFDLLCAFLDEMQRRGPQCIVDGWVDQNDRAGSLRKALMAMTLIDERAAELEKTSKQLRDEFSGLRARVSR